MNYFKIDGSKFHLKALNQAYLEVRNDGAYVASISNRSPINKIIKEVLNAWSKGYSVHYISFILGDRGFIVEVCKNDKVINNN